MSEATNLDDVRRSALEIADRSRRMWRTAILVFAFLEGACWVAYILLAVWDFPVSVLVGVAALLVYSTLSVLAFALKAHVDVSTQRILKAMEIPPGGNGAREGTRESSS